MVIDYSVGHRSVGERTNRETNLTFPGSETEQSFPVWVDFVREIRREKRPVDTPPSSISKKLSVARPFFSPEKVELWRMCKDLLKRWSSADPSQCGGAMKVGRVQEMRTTKLLKSVLQQDSPA